MAAQGRVPTRIGAGDVLRLEAETERLRWVDYQEGGGACRDSVIVDAAWSDQLLNAEATDKVRSRLLVGLGDLHNLAAWTCFDTGLTRAAARHWDRALELAREADDRELIANVHYRRGRMCLHHAERRDALEQFELGLAASHSAHSRAILYANEAWAYAGLGDRAMALSRLALAHEEFGRRPDGPAPGWARFFDETDLSAMTGVVHMELANTVAPAHTATAIPALTTAVVEYSAAMNRSRAFSLIALAAGHLLDGDFDHAARVGEQALATAGRVTSARLVDRLEPLARLADRYRANPHAAELSARIAAFPR